MLKEFMAHNKEVRLFQNDFLESLTHVNPVVPLLLWTPVIAYLFVLESTKNHALTTWVCFAGLGLIVWTLTEYLMHRFMFHFPAKSKVGKWFIFAFHGHHHDDPQDPTRLVMPPVPAIIYATALYFIYKLIIGAEHINCLLYTSPSPRD